MSFTTSKPILGICFDLDGTLVDSLPVTFSAFNAGFKAFGAPSLTPAEILSYFGPGEGQIFSRVVGPQNAKKAQEIFKSHMTQNVWKISLHRGVLELLQILSERKIPASIVTGRSRQTTDIILNHHPILTQFVSVITHDHVSQPKPSPEGIYLALKQMNLKPENALYVGDSVVDIRAAKEAGAFSVAALWDPFVSTDLLHQELPHHALQDPIKILDILST